MVSRSGEAELHCYGGPGLLAELKNNRLPLTTWADKPNPWFFADLGVGKEAAVTEEQWQQAVRQRYEALPAHLQGVVEYAYFAAQLAQKRPEIEAELMAHAAPTASASALDLPRHQGVAALRLLASPDNPLGWQMLGAGAAGVCVSLAQHHSLFTPEPGYPKHLQPVHYATHRRVQATRDEPFPGWFEEPIALSALAEWRLIIPKSRAQKHGGQTTVPHYTLGLPPGAVTRITLGPLASPETFQSLLDLTRLYQRYRGVPLARVRAAERTFTLQLSAL